MRGFSHDIMCTDILCDIGDPGFEPETVRPQL